MQTYSLSELERLPTMREGHFGNLKVANAQLRVWLNRMTVADGMPYGNQVSVERRVAGRWVEETTYQAR